MLYPPVQLSSWAKAVSASIESVMFQVSGSNEQVRGEAFLTKRTNVWFIWETGAFPITTHAKKDFITSICSSRECTLEERLEFWSNFLNVYWLIQQPYDQDFSSNTDVALDVLKLSCAESLFYTDSQAGGSGRRSLVRPEQKPVLLNMHPIRQFCLPGEAVLDLCMETRSIAKACLSALKHIKFFGCEVDGSCLSNSMHSIFELFVHQIPRNDSNINDSEDIQKATRPSLP